VRPVWLGASLQPLEGEDFSAYGVGKEDGGVVLIEVPQDSEAARRGLMEGDLVQQVNGQAVRTADELVQACVRAGNKPLKLKVVRNQQTMQLVIAQHAWVQLETAPAQTK
jgi:S1-C subfamily serine protease